MKVLSLAILVILCLPIAVASSENETTDLSLTVVLDLPLYTEIKYDSLFKIAQKPCFPGKSVTIRYNLSKDGLIIKEDSFTKTVNCYTSTSTGNFIAPETGNYTLCGIITDSTAKEMDFSNNAACMDLEILAQNNDSETGLSPDMPEDKNAEETNVSNILCNLDISIATNHSIFYEKGQSINFTPAINNKTFPFRIEYCIEDLFS